MKLKPHLRYFLAVATVAILLGLYLGTEVAINWPVQVPSFASVRAGYTPSDAWLLDRHGQVLDSARIQFKVRRLAWTPIAQVSPALIAALISGEDRRFWQHHGVDWASALGAARDQILHRHRRGASTITMQLATLLQGKSPTSGDRGAGAWATKFRQVRTAQALERHWTKPQILEAYLNLLQYRGELQGIAAAAAQLAGKSPSSLSQPESLVLAALLPAPSATAERVMARACARSRALRLAASCDVIRATATALLGSGPDLPTDHLAPQLAQALLTHPGERLHTSLDARVQRLTRATVRNHLLELADHNVRDGAALVVDNGTGEVLAYVGSAGPKSGARHVDGVQAARQAGSTLKPFLYELAFERHYLTAASLLNDSPLSLDTASGVYIPQDYDHDFKGVVSVRTALASSLNVPAVRTLVLVGVEAFRNRLNALGYTGIRQDGEYYGYSLALGSAEVTLWQQAQAYRVLARGGLASPLTLWPGPHAGTAVPAPHRLLPADASFIVGDILSDRVARTVTFGLDSHLNTTFWSAAKTGTSEDMRDNWCIGFSEQFTVAVWVGNFEGDSMHDVSGVTGAAAIWHDLMVALNQGLISRKPPPPPGVSLVATQFTPAVEPARPEWYLAGTNRAPGGMIAAPPSAFPKIASPANGMVIAIDPDIPADHQRVLIAVNGASPSMTLRLNGKDLGAALTKRLWAPTPGVYHLTLEDRGGEMLDRVRFTVRGPPGT